MYDKGNKTIFRIDIRMICAIVTYKIVHSTEITIS